MREEAELITLKANGRRATATASDPVTTGSVGLPVRVRLSADYDGLQAILVFKCGDDSVDVALLGQDVTVPPQLVTERGKMLAMGVYATRPDGEVVIPTVWAEVGIVREGAAPSGVDPAEPTPSWAAQVQQWASDAAESAETATETVESIRADMDEFNAESAEVLEDARAATVAANGAATNANTAASAANTSATAADAATASAVTATGAANDAASAANAAAALATSAAGVATDAAGNADIATAAVRAATANAQTATSNANQATQAATQATEQADQATTNANQAAQSATTATTNANAATESASAAASAANAAAVTASQEAEGASAAAELANAATTAATNATQAATAATEAATQAASTANDAAERAEDAASSASTAASQADAATTAANAATTAATAATSGATQAAQAANGAASAASQAASDATEAAGMARRASAATWLSGNVPIGSIAEGELLTASDVYATPPRGVDVYGKSEQEGTPTPDDPQEIESVGSRNLCGGIALLSNIQTAMPTATTGSDTDGNYIRYTGAMATTDGKDIATGMFKANTQYTVILKYAHESNGVVTQVRVVYTDGTTAAIQNVNVAANTVTTVAYTTAANKTVKSLQAVWITGTTRLYYDGCGIFEGEIATSEFVPYDCMALNARGKNHIDTSFDYSCTIRGVTLSQHDGEVTFDGTFSSGVNAVSVAYGADAYNNANYINSLAIDSRFAFLLPPGQYSLSYDSNVTTGAMVCNVLYGEIGGTVSNGKASIISHRSSSSNPTTITRWVYAMLVARVTDSGSATVHGTIKNIQLEVSSTATDYEPYVGTTVPIPLQGHELRSLPDGTRDELRLTYQGPSETEGMGTFGVELVQRVDEVTIDRFEAMTGRADISANDFCSAALAPSAIYKTTSSGHADRMLCDSFVPYADLTTVPTTAGHNNQCSYQSGYRLAWFRLEATKFPDLSTANAWLAENPITVFLEFNDEQTYDLGTVDLPVLPAPDLNAWADGGSVRPTMEMGYEQDINIVIANIGAALADLATS